MKRCNFLLFFIFPCTISMGRMKVKMERERWGRENFLREIISFSQKAKTPQQNQNSSLYFVTACRLTEDKQYLIQLCILNTQNRMLPLAGDQK